MNPWLTSLVSLAAVAVFSPVAGAAPLTIENKTLSVTYDSGAGTFSVAEKASGKVFLTDGKLHGTATRAIVGPTTDRVFGSGKCIHVRRADGGSTSLKLFDDVPFLFIDGDLCNLGKEMLDVPKTVPATFTLDLGKPADQLRTLGTAGLLAPDKNPGSYLFLTLADPATRRGVVAGWLTNDRGSGVVFSDVKDGKVELQARIDYGHLRIPAPGPAKAGINLAQLETLVIGIFDDARLGEEQFGDAIAKHYRIKLHPQMAGYCTWYADKHGAAGDEKSTIELAEFAAKELKPFGFSFVQIDDQWQAGGKYNGPRRGFDRVRPDGPYAHGIKPVADAIDRLGLTTGLWFLPFARSHQDPEYKNRQDWFVRRADGKFYILSWGGTALDLTNPEVKTHLAELVKTIHSWGINYFKMDGLWTGTATNEMYVHDGYRDDRIGDNAPFHDPMKTNIEAYRDGLRLLREAAGPDVFFSGCSVSQNMRSLGGSIGLVDSMRIGPDNRCVWGNYEEELESKEGGSLVTGPVRGSRLYFLNGRTWWNDPDPVYVRDRIPLRHAQLLASWVAISGQFNLNSDWTPGLSAQRLDVLKRTMLPHDATARPVDYFDAALPAIWLVSSNGNSGGKGDSPIFADTKIGTVPAVRRDVLGLFNWESKDSTIGCTAAKAGLDPAKTYYAFDFWSNAPAASFRGEFKFDVPAESCRVVAVRAAEGHPTLVSTSRHVTQGIVDVADENWSESSRKLTGTSRVVGGDPYELRIAGLDDGGRWAIASVAVSAEDQAAGATIAAKPVAAGEDGWLRIGIASKQSRAVRWTITFESRRD